MHGTLALLLSFILSVNSFNFSVGSDFTMMRYKRLGEADILQRATTADDILVISQATNAKHVERRL